LGLPAVPGRLGDLELPTDLGEFLALVEQLVAFGELADDLFWGVMPLLHAVLLAPFWSIGTLVRGGSFQGDQRTTKLDKVESIDSNNLTVEEAQARASLINEEAEALQDSTLVKVFSWQDLLENATEELFKLLK
jgi:hypothetical protein